MVNNVVACSCAKCLSVISKSSYIFHTFLPSIALGCERQYSVFLCHQCLTTSANKACMSGTCCQKAFLFVCFGHQRTSWARILVKYLGIYVTKHPLERQHLNFSARIVKSENVRVLQSNAEGLPHFVYLSPSLFVENK